MSLRRKVYVSILTILAVMFLFPILALKLGGAMAGMALCFLLFFVIDPITVLCLSIVAGTEIKKLFWIPPATSIAFPLCFSLVVQEWVTDLFIYSGVYFAIGMLAMVGTHWGIRLYYARKHPDDPAESPSGNR